MIEMIATSSTSSGEQIVAAIRAGDAGALGELFRRKHATLQGLARSYVDSDAIAEEVVQETWLAVVNGIDRFERRSTFETWLFGILVNQARRHRARERRAVPFSAIEHADADEPSPRPWERPERRLLSLEARAHLRRALAELPERQRAVVALRDVEGCSAQEVCRRLALSEENQRVLLHRGRSRLRAALDAYIGAEVTAVAA